MDVRAGGPAAVAGLQVGDILLKINGDEITDQANLRIQEAALAPGSVARLEGLRDGAPISVEVTLLQRPNAAELTGS
jgi:S1-C subfamily serine protease